VESAAEWAWNTHKKGETKKPGSSPTGVGNARAPYVLLLADTTKVPDEIWQTFADYGGKQVVRRRYVARWTIEGSTVPVLTVFETGRDSWLSGCERVQPRRYR